MTADEADRQDDKQQRTATAVICFQGKRKKKKKNKEWKEGGMNK